MWPPDLLARAETLLAQLRAQSLRVALAESCTGGLVAALLTEIPGASDVFGRGWVTYANEAKHQELGVSLDTLRTHGAVSKACAVEMATGARKKSGADIAISITGIAGPGGGSAEKPVGTVFIARATQKEAVCESYHFSGTRSEIRLQSVAVALALIDPTAQLSFSSFPRTRESRNQ